MTVDLQGFDRLGWFLNEFGPIQQKNVPNQFQLNEPKQFHASNYTSTK